jgi:hypothetical protein
MAVLSAGPDVHNRTPVSVSAAFSVKQAPSNAPPMFGFKG